MSKAVLMIDMPERCSECDLYSHHRRHCGRDNHTVDGNKKPNWCPLISEPEKHATYDSKHEHSADYYLGWNACLDKLEGKEDE